MQLQSNLFPGWAGMAIRRRCKKVTSEDAETPKVKRWYERTSVTLCVALMLAVIALGFVHIITGVESPFELPVDVALKESFGYRETFINAAAIEALPYTAARLKYPLGCRVLQRRGYLPTGHTFEARIMVGQRQNIEQWQAEFARSLGRVEPLWEERFQDAAGDAQADNREGIARARVGDYQAALKAFGRAVRKAPTSAETCYNRALVYVTVGNLGQAAEDLGRVAAIRPADVEAHVERGRLYLAIGRYEEAGDAFAKAIETDATHPQAYLGRALAAYALGRYGRAWQDIEKLQTLGTPAPPTFILALRHASGRDPGT